MIVGGQPHRKPSGWLDGGYMHGDVDECRLADVLIEDYVGPPLYTGRPTSPMRVVSTHTLTETMCLLEDGLVARFHTIPHPRGIGEPVAEYRVRRKLESRVTWARGHERLAFPEEAQRSAA